MVESAVKAFRERERTGREALEDAQRRSVSAEAALEALRKASRGKEISLEQGRSTVREAEDGRDAALREKMALEAVLASVRSEAERADHTASAEA